MKNFLIEYSQLSQWEYAFAAWKVELIFGRICSICDSCQSHVTLFVTFQYFDENVDMTLKRKRLNQTEEDEKVIETKQKIT